MKRVWLSFIVVVATLIGVAVSAGLQKPSDSKRYGLDKRVPWTTSRIKGSPEPPPPYRTENAFPKLKFNEPLDMAAAPQADRLFVVERYGKIYSFPNDPKAERADLLLDLNRQRGTTLVIVTHDLELARRAHRVVHLAAGRIARIETCA